MLEFICQCWSVAWRRGVASKLLRLVFFLKFGSCWLQSNSDVVVTALIDIYSHVHACLHAVCEHEWGDSSWSHTSMNCGKEVQTVIVVFTTVQCVLNWANCSLLSAIFCSLKIIMVSTSNPTFLWYWWTINIIMQLGYSGINVALHMSSTMHACTFYVHYLSM